MEPIVQPGPGSTPTRSRRVVGGLIRGALVLMALGFIGVWVGRHVPSRPRHVAFQTAPIAEADLAPGDMRIVSVDGKMELVLQGDRVLAGLSPATVAKIREDLARSSDRDSGGAGGFASMIKHSVADAIGAHVSYPVSDITDMSYSDGELIIETRSNGRVRLFNNDRGDSGKGPVFSEEDAQRFIEAVNARRR